MPRLGRIDFHPATLHIIACSQLGCNVRLVGRSKSGFTTSQLEAQGWKRVKQSVFICGQHGG